MTLEHIPAQPDPENVETELQLIIAHTKLVDDIRRVIDIDAGLEEIIGRQATEDEGEI